MFVPRGGTKGVSGQTALGELEVDVDVLVAESPAGLEEGEAFPGADFVVRAQALHTDLYLSPKGGQRL